MKEIRMSLDDVLLFPQNNPEGWLYLPPQKWSLTTEGIFADVEDDPSPDLEDDIPAEAKEKGWLETLDNQTIEDVIENLKYRYENPTAEQRLEAFIFYFENDAFIVT